MAKYSLKMIKILSSLHSIPLLLFFFQYTIQDSPKIQPFSFKQGIKVGDKTTALCLAESNSPLSYSWRRNGESLTENEEQRFKTDEELSVLVLEPVKLEHSGNYTCLVKSKDGSDSFTAVLVVEASPVWKIEPENITAIPGNRHVFRCSANGSPNPVISWNKILEHSGNDPSVMNVGNGDSLTFESLEPEDAGTYECIASNGVEPTLRKFVVLGIRGTKCIKPPYLI